MFYQLALTLVAAALTLADPVPDPGGYHHEPLPYHFDYHVKDHWKHTHFGQHEKSDGKGVWGHYTVDLPDGRKQRVDYHADHHKGYVAKVSYHGKAHHPKHYGHGGTFFGHHHGGYGGGHGHGHGHGHH